MNLINVRPDQLHKVWPDIKHGVEKVAQTNNHWIPEDLYSAVKHKTVQLYVREDAPDQGFVALQQQETDSGLVLHVWALYSSAGDFHLLEEGGDQVKNYAQSIGAKAITFSTTRRGWAKQAIKLGYKEDLVTYRCEL